MPPETIIGWDLGGAHVKAARLQADGTVDRVRQFPCPLWQGMSHLEAAVGETCAALGEASLHAITMTGEMADLFANRGEGVVRLAHAMEECLPGATLRFFAGVRGFVDPADVAAHPYAIASANWRASATLIARRLPDALFLDIGSTTTDLVLVRGGRVEARGSDDAERLAAGELVYTGASRTPVMALAERVPFDGEWVPVIPEHFATVADVYRLLDRLPATLDQHATADGGEKSVAGSARRLARTIGRDAEMAPLASWRRLAAWLARAHATRIDDACARLLSRSGLAAHAPVVLAGAGRFLAADLASLDGRRRIEFGSLACVQPAEQDRASECAPAVAVSCLARQE